MNDQEYENIKDAVELNRRYYISKAVRNIEKTEPGNRYLVYLAIWLSLMFLAFILESQLF